MKNMKLCRAVGTGALLFALSAGGAHATLLSFNITGSGTYTVDTGDITAATTSKTIPATEVINGIVDAGGTSGLSGGDLATFSTLTLDTVVGPFAFTLTTGDLIFSFTSVSSVLIVPTGTTTQGSISQQFHGTVTGDTTSGSAFLGQSVSLSETCTQTGTGAAISCSESLRTPGLPTTVPEPATAALFGLGLLGLGVFRRKRAA